MTARRPFALPDNHVYVVTVRDGLDPLTCAESVYQDVISFVPGEPSYREVGYRHIDGVEHVVFFSANGALYLATQAHVHGHPVMS